MRQSNSGKASIKAKPNEWGDEYYFEIPVKASLDETATTKVKVGDIGYWPPGRAMAIFFGRTPIRLGLTRFPQARSTSSEKSSITQPS